MGKVIDLLGQRFGKMVVLSRLPNNKHYRAMWFCRCDCGTEKPANGIMLRKGSITSCGCTQAFPKGNIPYNKGMKRGSLSPQTEFKEGLIPHNFKGIGTPRIVGSRREVVATLADERILRVSRGKSYSTKKRTSYARYLWITHIGEIPKGMVIFNNGDKENIKLEYLEIITRSELVIRNKSGFLLKKHK